MGRRPGADGGGAGSSCGTEATGSRHNGLGGAGIIGLPSLSQDQGGGEQFRLAKQIAQEFKALGHPVQAALEAPDLGIDRGRAAVRRTAKHSKRFACAMRRIRRTRRFCRQLKTTDATRS